MKSFMRKALQAGYALALAASLRIQSEERILYEKGVQRLQALSSKKHVHTSRFPQISDFTIHSSAYALSPFLYEQFTNTVPQSVQQENLETRLLRYLPNVVSTVYVEPYLDQNGKKLNAMKRGHGFLLSQDGLFITPWHNIEPIDREKAKESKMFTISYSSQNEIRIGKARLLYSTKENDLVVCQIENVYYLDIVSPQIAEHFPCIQDDLNVLCRIFPFHYELQVTNRITRNSILQGEPFRGQEIVFEKENAKVTSIIPQFLYRYPVTLILSLPMTEHASSSQTSENSSKREVNLRFGKEKTDIPYQLRSFGKTYHGQSGSVAFTKGNLSGMLRSISADGTEAYFIPSKIIRGFIECIYQAGQEQPVFSDGITSPEDR